MGYTTEFEGRIELDRALDEELYQFLMKLNETRRMKRDPKKLEEMGFTGDYGVEGEFFIDGAGYYGQAEDESILDYNRPPKTQPGLWCQWRPTLDRKGLEWDQGEKFYCADEWMMYLIDRILKPAGYVANGTIYAQGEDSEDTWELHVRDNQVSVICS